MNIIERLNGRRAAYITRHGTAPRTWLLPLEDWRELQTWCAEHGIQRSRSRSKRRQGIWLFGMQCRLASERSAAESEAAMDWWEAPQEWGEGAPPESVGYQIEAGYVLPGTALSEDTSAVQQTGPVVGDFTGLTAEKLRQMRQQFLMQKKISWTEADTNAALLWAIDALDASED